LRILKDVAIMIGSVGNGDEPVTDQEAGDITQLLLDHHAGNESAFDKLVTLVYDDLKQIAHRQLQRARHGSLIDTTGLVHEAYLKLVDQARVRVENRGHFFAVAACAMRHIVIDFIRRRTAARRGGGAPRQPFDEEQLVVGNDFERLLAVNRAISRLAEIDERLVRVVDCRMFAGLTDDETAQALQVSPRTVPRAWVRARAWLKHELASEGSNARG